MQGQNQSNELTHEQALNFSSFPMQNITETAKEIVDLWAYADPIIEEKYHNCTAWDWQVRSIYLTEDKRYQHINISVPLDNAYLVVIVDVNKKQIIGHHILTLG